MTAASPNAVFGAIVARAQPHVSGRLALSQRQDAHLSAFGLGEAGDYGDFTIFCGDGYANVCFAAAFLREQLLRLAGAFGDVRPRFDISEDELFCPPRLVAMELVPARCEPGDADVLLRTGVELMALAQWQGGPSFSQRCGQLAEKVKALHREGVPAEQLEIFRRGLLYFAERLS